MRLGGPDQLTLAEMPDPVPGAGEVLLDVAYAGCNWADTQVRMGINPHSMTYPMVLGFEVSESRRPRPRGDGRQDRRSSRRLPREGRRLRREMRRERCGMIRLPDAVGLDVAAAFPIQALTAYHMMWTVYGGVGKADTVLVNAVGGGVGLMCTQLAKHAGARVIGTTGTRGKEKRALEYGAERVVVTSTEDFENAVLDFTNGKGVDLAINSYGATMLDRTFNVVKKLGHIVSIGEAEGQPFKNIRERILPRSQTFTRLHLGHVDQPCRNGRGASTTCWPASPPAG